MGCNGVGKRDVKTLEEVEEEGGGYIRGLKWPARYLHVQKHKIYDGNLQCNADTQRGDRDFDSPSSRKTWRMEG